MEFVIAIDQGTTSSRCTLYSSDLKVVCAKSMKFTQSYPKSGWVEHDPDEIFSGVYSLLLSTVGGSSVNNKNCVIGITNQRETIVAVDSRSGKPLHSALVWMDTRAGHEVESRLKHEEQVFRLSGLRMSTYFSAGKIRWMLDNVAAVSEAAKGGHLVMTTIDGYILHRLSRGGWQTDCTNASRYQLMDIGTLSWSNELLAIWGIQESALPNLVKSCGAQFGEIACPELFQSKLNGVRVTGVLGDQLASLLGLGCTQPGTAKLTLGTGAFLLVNTGPKLVHVPGLISTLAYRFNDVTCYAVEGSCASACRLLDYLSDQLHMFANAQELDLCANKVLGSDGVLIVPALSGLLAPHWKPDVKASIRGLTLQHDRNHVARAALESIAHQVADILDCYPDHVSSIVCDGGGSKSRVLLQVIADFCRVTVRKVKNPEATSMGAAMAAAIGAGMYTLEDCARQVEVESEFKPSMDASLVALARTGWRKAIAETINN